MFSVPLQLMEIKHQNVCAFVGAFLDPSRAILVWEYCAKGSLQDIIWNRNIKLDQMFMFALSHDVAKVSRIIIGGIASESRQRFHK